LRDKLGGGNAAGIQQVGAGLLKKQTTTDAGVCRIVVEAGYTGGCGLD